MATCPVCGHEFEPEDSQNAVCPACGAVFAGDASENSATDETPQEEPASREVPREEQPTQVIPSEEAPTQVVPREEPATQEIPQEEPPTQEIPHTAPTEPYPATGASGAGATGEPPAGPEIHPDIADPYRPSPLKRAWMDFKASPGKLWIILKLALFQFVPGVGSLVLSGYAYTWAREQALGRHLPLPAKIVRPGVLDNGLYIYGVSVIMTVVFFVLGLFAATVFSALRLFIIFTLLVILFVVCCGPFFAVMNMRTALCGRVRSGLNLKRAWSLFAAPGKTGQVFAAYWGPAALVVLLTFVCYLLLFMVVMGSSISVAYGMSGVYHSDYYIIAQLLAMMLSFIPITILVLFAVFFVSTAATLVTARALGYWAQDFHPEAWPEYQENVKYYMDRAV